MVLTNTQGLGFAIPVEAVRQRYEKVKFTQAQLFTSEYCGVCGKNSSTLRYCEHCGVELDAHQPLISDNFLKQKEANFVGVKIINCNNCKSPVSVGEKYCSKCGTTMIK